MPVYPTGNPVTKKPEPDKQRWLGVLIAVCWIFAVLLALVPGILVLAYPDYTGGDFYSAVGFTAFIYAVALGFTAGILREYLKKAEK